MNKSMGKLMIGGMALLLLAGSIVVLAQAPGGPGGPRNFDPAQFNQMMLDRYKEALQPTDDEWKAISPLVEKVMTLQRESMGGRMRFMGGPGGQGMGRQRPQGQNQPQGQDQQQRRRGPGFGQPDPDMEALQAVLDSSNPSQDEIKAKLTALRDARKKKAAELQTAREALVQVLTLKQEATLVLSGLLE